MAAPSAGIADPMDTAGPRITMLLQNLDLADRSQADELLNLVYKELRVLANQHMRRERAAHTLQPTALVHEAYLRLVGGQKIDWESRAHFFGIAARSMRQVQSSAAPPPQSAEVVMDQDQINQAEWENPENWSGPRALALYFSKRDSRTVVPKRLTWMGWTVNTGKNAGVFWLVAVLMGIPLLVIVAVVLGGG